MEIVALDHFFSQNLLYVVLQSVKKPTFTLASREVHCAQHTGNHDLYALVMAHSADKCYLNTNTLKHVSECLRMDDGLMRRAAKEEGKGDVKVLFFCNEKTFLRKLG